MLKKQHYAKKLALIGETVKYYIEEMKPDLELARAQLENTFRDGQHLATQYSEAQWLWTPAPGVWSAAGCLEHLNQTNREYISAIRRVVESVDAERSTSAEFRYRLLERWFVKSLEPPVRIKLKAPEVFAPAAAKSRETSMAEWQRIHLELLALVEGSEPFHLARNKVTSPVSRHIRFSLGIVFRLIAAHNRRHLYQARQMTARAPSSAAASR